MAGRRHRYPGACPPSLPAALTWGLEVECYQLAATDPHGQGVVVGGVETLALGVDAGELQAVVLQELLAFDLVDVLFRLGLREGGHISVTGPLCADLWEETAQCKPGACSFSRCFNHPRPLPNTILSSLGSVTIRLCSPALPLQAFARCPTPMVESIKTTLGDRA